MIISVTPQGHGNSKFTPERQRVIIQAVRAGASVRLAASAAAVSENVLRRWIREGETDNEGDDADAPVTDKGQFAIAYHLAEYEFAQTQLNNIQVNSIADWRASAWLLERRYPNEYGKQVELKGGADAPIIVSPERMTSVLEMMAQYEREQLGQLQQDMGEVRARPD